MRKNYKSYLLCIVTSFYWFSLYTYVPILTPYAESLGSSYKMMGLIAGSYGFAQMVLRIPLGIWSDTINKRKIFIISGIVLALISSIGPYIIPTPASLLFFRSLSGAAAATWVTFTVLYTSYFEDGSSSKAIGIINSFNNSGQMFAMLLGGIIAQNFGQRYTFLLGSIGAVAGLILSFYIYEEKNIQRVPLKPRDIAEVASSKSLLFVSFLAILSQLITFATSFGFTPVAAKAIGADSFQLGVLSTLSTLPVIFASAMGGTIFARKFGEKNTIAGGFVLTALSCFSIPFIKNINVLYISQFIGGFGRGLVFSLLMALSIKSVDYSKRATAMGFFQAIYGLGMFIGPVMVGFLSDIGSLSLGFSAAGIIGLTAAFLTFAFAKGF